MRKSKYNIGDIFTFGNPESVGYILDVQLNEKDDVFEYDLKWINYPLLTPTTKWKENVLTARITSGKWKLQSHEGFPQVDNREFLEHLIQK